MRQRVAELERENEELKGKLQASASEDDDSCSDDIYVRVNRFFKQRGISGDRPAEVMLLAINVMVSLYHLDYFQESSDDLTNATYKAFLGAIKSIVDGCESKLAKKPSSFPYLWLLESFPVIRTAGSASHNDWLPLHWFFHAAASSEDSEVMLSAYCEDSLAKDFSPFTIACGRPDANIAFLEITLSITSSLAHHRNADGSTALFHAASTSTSLEFVQWLHDKFPGAMHCTDIYGFSVLNYVCYSGGDVRILEYLRSQQPELVFQSSHTKLLPLHDAAINVNGGIEFLNLICRVYPPALSACDDCGALPLHLACEFGSLDMVKYLTGQLESGVCSADYEGLLPIHYASKRAQKDVAMLDYLISLNPEGRVIAASRGEDDGRGDVFSSIVSNLSDKFKKIKVVYEDIRAEIRNSESLRAASAKIREKMSPTKQPAAQDQGAEEKKVKLRSRHTRSSIIVEGHAPH